MQVVPTGSVHFKVRHSGEHFSWVKPTTTIHNIILGQLWNDQVRDADDDDASSVALWTGHNVLSEILCRERRTIFMLLHQRARTPRNTYVFDYLAKRIVNLITELC